MKYSQGLTAISIVLTALCGCAAMLLVPGTVHDPAPARLAAVVGLWVAAIGLAATARRLNR